MKDNKYNLIFTENAARELNHLISYIKNDLDNPIAALSVYETIFNAVKRLSIFPYSCPELRVKSRFGNSFRKLVVRKNYIVVYMVDETEKKIIIEHICDGRQDYQQIFK